VGGVATALSTGLIWVNLKDHNLIWMAPIVVIAGSIVSLIATKFMNRTVCEIGQAKPDEDKK
jgi:hypothetical protein